MQVFGHAPNWVDNNLPKSKVKTLLKQTKENIVRSEISKQNLNKVLCVAIEYKFVREKFKGKNFREVGDVPGILLKHQLKPFVVVPHFRNLQIST